MTPALLTNTHTHTHAHAQAYQLGACLDGWISSVSRSVKRRRSSTSSHVSVKRVLVALSRPPDDQTLVIRAREGARLEVRASAKGEGQVRRGKERSDELTRHAYGAPTSKAGFSNQTMLLPTLLLFLTS